jgi:mannose-6-phosphate isomerase-like protein (cupin superfamily)
MDGTRSARRIAHADLPIVASPSGLPSQHIVSSQIGSETIFVGQQWLEPGDRVLLHTHPVEEALTFLTGTGDANLGSEAVAIGPGISLYIPPGVVHGFRNTGSETLKVMIVFQGPRFAETIICEDQEMK